MVYQKRLLDEFLSHCDIDLVANLPSYRNKANRRTTYSFYDWEDQDLEYYDLGYHGLIQQNGRCSDKKADFKAIFFLQPKDWGQILDRALTGSELHQKLLGSNADDTVAIASPMRLLHTEISEPFRCFALVRSNKSWNLKALGSVTLAANGHYSIQDYLTMIAIEDEMLAPCTGLGEISANIISMADVGLAHEETKRNLKYLLIEIESELRCHRTRRQPSNVTRERLGERQITKTDNDLPKLQIWQRASEREDKAYQKPNFQIIRQVPARNRNAATRILTLDDGHPRGITQPKMLREVEAQDEGYLSTKAFFDMLAGVPNATGDTTHPLSTENWCFVKDVPFIYKQAYTERECLEISLLDIEPKKIYRTFCTNRTAEPAPRTVSDKSLGICVKATNNTVCQERKSPTVLVPTTKMEELSATLIPTKPASTPRIRSFPIDVSIDSALITAWKSLVLPHIAKIVPPDDDSSITASLVRRGTTAKDSRPVIRIQTSKPRSAQQREDITKKIQKRLSAFESIQITFAVGSVRRTAQRSDLEVLPCAAQNTGFSPRPPMGVSIGVGGSTRDTATLGGYIYVDNIPHILTVHHLFADEEAKITYKPGTAVTQPSWQEVKDFSESWEGIRVSREPFHPACIRKAFEKMKSCLHSFSFGCLTHSSGFRNRVARDGSNVEMDWAICKVEGSRVGCNVTPCNTRWCENAVEVVPGGDVFAVGRTSGNQDGVVNGFTTYFCQQNEDGTYRESEEWTILRSDDCAEENWISSGIGVDGDSGSWILEKETSNVIGLVWGRNHKEGENNDEIFTYFTPILDIFEDIREITGASTISIYKPKSNCLADTDREQQVVQGRIMDSRISSQLSKKICRICSREVSDDEIGESADLLHNEITLLNRARQDNQVILKLRGLASGC